MQSVVWDVSGGKQRELRNIASAAELFTMNQTLRCNSDCDVNPHRQSTTTEYVTSNCKKYLSVMNELCAKLCDFHSVVFQL